MGDPDPGVEILINMLFLRESVLSYQSPVLLHTSSFKFRVRNLLGSTTTTVSFTNVRLGLLNSHKFEY